MEDFVRTPPRASTVYKTKLLLTMPNHVAKDTLKSFFAVSGPEGSFVYKRGQERIPENYYRRPTPYGLAEFSLDLVSWSSRHPFLLK